MSRSSRLLATGVATALLVPLALVTTSPAAVAATELDRTPSIAAGDWLAAQAEVAGSGETAEAYFAPPSLDPITFGYAADAIVSFRAVGQHLDVADQLSRGYAANLDAHLRPRFLAGGTYLSAQNVAKAVLAAATEDAATSYGGQDLVALLVSTVGEDGRAANQGGSQEGASDLVAQTFAVRALATASTDTVLIGRAAEALLSARCANGGYPVSFDQEVCTSDVGMTAEVAISLQRVAEALDDASYATEATAAMIWVGGRPMPGQPGVPQHGTSSSLNLVVSRAIVAVRGPDSLGGAFSAADQARSLQLDSVSARGDLASAVGFVPADLAHLRRIEQAGALSDTDVLGGIATVSRYYPALEVLDGTVELADVAPSSAFSYEIGWLSGTGITTGYDEADGSTTFRGAQPVLREQMAAFLYRLAHEGSNPVGEDPTADFEDVTGAHVFSRHIAWLADEGITTGYADGTFRPGQPVLREQMAAFLYRLAGSPEVQLPGGTPFVDVAPSHTFYREIVWMASENISYGYDDGRFDPKAPVLREQMAAFLFRYDDRFSDVDQ